jgi:hypothetical protein
MSEIEELVLASENRRQTELSLEDVASAEARLKKLNVADGTFDPATREEAVVGGIPYDEAETTS